MEEDLLTTTEAARIAGVGTSSVKRWADSNLLRCVRTVGGHRRFRREELERFLCEHGSSLATVSHGIEWVELLLHAGTLEIQGEILRARDRLGAFFRVADELGEALVELGARWQRGEIGVIEEHIASEKLARALQRVAESIPGQGDDPACLVAAAEQDEHTLGLSLLELCLREASWTCLWAGRKTPLDEVTRLASDGAVNMVALSASLASSDAAMLAEQARRVGDACLRAGVIFVVGGSGAWPKLKYGTRFRDFASFAQMAREWRQSRREQL